MPSFQVTASSLNVREGPSISSPAVGFLSRGDVVEVLEWSPDRYWVRVRREGLEGHCAAKYLIPADAVAEAVSSFPWMPIALAEAGQREVPGAGTNARIGTYLRSTNLPAPLNETDETPWCSAFVNWCVERAGFAGTDSAWARDWLNWGRPLDAPEPGCVVVLRRGDHSGHVGFYVGETATHLKLFGGNQANQVCEREYPRADLLGYRAPAD